MKPLQEEEFFSVYRRLTYDDRERIKSIAMYLTYAQKLSIDPPPTPAEPQPNAAYFNADRI